MANLKLTIGLLLVFVTMIESTCDYMGAGECYSQLGEGMTDLNAICSVINEIPDMINSCLEMVDTCDPDTRNAFQTSADQILMGVQAQSQFCGSGCEDTDLAAVGEEIGQCFGTLEQLGDGGDPCVLIQNSFDCVETATGTCEADFLTQVVGHVIKSVAPYASQCQPPVTYKGKEIVIDSSDCSNAQYVYMGCLLPLSVIFGDDGEEENMNKDEDDDDKSLARMLDMCDKIIQNRDAITRSMECIEALHRDCPDITVEGSDMPNPDVILQQFEGYIGICSSACPVKKEVFIQSDQCTSDIDSQFSVTQETFNPEKTAVEEPGFCSAAEGFKSCFEDAFRPCPELHAATINFIQADSDDPISRSFQACGLELPPGVNNGRRIVFSMGLLFLGVFMLIA